MSVYLKVKAKTLAEEAKIIRLERRRAKARARWLGSKDRKGAHLVATNQVLDLRHHETEVVRVEARATHLARNFLMGNPYRTVEKVNHPHRKGPDWDRVQRMVEKYGQGDARDLRQRLAEWKDEKAA